jgi:hypothetical protein
LHVADDQNAAGLPQDAGLGLPAVMSAGMAVRGKCQILIPEGATVCA